MGRILVMGGTGTIGRYLVDKLVADPGGHEIVAMARSDASAASLEKAGIASVRADLDRPETLDGAMHGIDTLFMLKPYGLDYLIQSKIVIDAARRAGVGHVVNLGSHGDDDTVWASIGWNRMVEAYLAVSGMEWTHLRPNFFMDNVGPRTDPETRDIRHFFGDNPVSWIAAEDIAAVAAAVLRDVDAHRHAVYPLASEAATVAEIAALISERTGREYRALYVEPEEALAQLQAAGWGSDFAKPFVAYMVAIADGCVPEVADTFDTIAQVTGRPAIGWPEFIARNETSFLT